MPMEIDPDVLEMVRDQLSRDPPPSTSALYGRAAHMNEEIWDLSLRQFHAMYPLRVKREEAREEASGPTDPGVPPTSPVPDDGSDPGDAGTYDPVGPEASGASHGDAGVSRRLGPDTRAEIRRVLLSTARDVAAAESVTGLAEVLDGIPRRVDEVVAILGSAPAPGSSAGS